MSDPQNYTIGWICAIKTEYIAAQVLLDEKHEGPIYVSPHDNNNYALGKISNHNVVIAVLPGGEYGTSSAATVARDMLSSFPNVRIGVMVGIGGGAPSSKHDIRLGDIVVSAPRDGRGGVLAYSFGKAIQDEEFQMTAFLNQPPTLLRTAISGLQTQYEIDGHQLEETISRVLETKPRLRRTLNRPDSNSDRLYKPEITHASACTTVCTTDPSTLVFRTERMDDEDNPAVHYGLIASADQLMKDAKIRNKLAAEHDVLCFEMEAAGLVNHFPCLVIRGICDYSDSHKTKEWQGYAAMTAAAYAKDLLSQIHPNKVEAEKTINELLSSVSDAVSRTEADINLLKSGFDRRENNEILNWITPIEYGPQHSDFLRRREPETGQWFLDSTEYQTWLNSSTQTLYCPGIPGSGKTILTAIVIDDLLKRFQNNPTIGIAYIYFNFRKLDDQIIENLLASLLKQLVRGQPFPETVKDLYDRHRQKQTRPLINDILVALQSVSTMYSKVFIVVDALDECQTSGNCLQQFLSHIFSLQANSATKFLATSRHIPVIDEEFINFQRLEILANSEDVHRYLHGHMSGLLNFVAKRPDIQEEIVINITHASDGMFLLAQLYFDSLKDKTSVREIKSALKYFKKQSDQSLNQDGNRKVLEKAYEQAMDRIDCQMQGLRLLGRNVLSWITCAKRPLTIKELQHALAVNIGDTELDEDNVREINDMISVCAGLVTVDEESKVIRLVHYTAQEYFERTKQHWFPEIETHITKICTTYLSFEVFDAGVCRRWDELEERLQTYSFYEYAALFWGLHARKTDTICDAAMEFLSQNMKVEASFQPLRYDRLFGYLNLEHVREITGLHLAAYFGVEKAILSLIERIDVDRKDIWGRTPLSHASENGHDVVAQLLLEKGANIESKDQHGQTPLSWAAQNGQEAVIQLLLERGADIESKARLGQTHLSWAAQNGQEAFIQLLLEKDSDIEHKNQHGQTPLSLAVQYGHEAVVQQLLDKGADIESKDQHGQTPLSLAVQKGHEAVVQQLLDKGAHIESRDQLGQTPLSLAIVCGFESVAWLLINKGADIESKRSSDGETPLSLAITYGRGALISPLIEKGADIETRNLNGQTPLLLAIEYGRDAVVWLLFERGADTNAKDLLGLTPLVYASQYGSQNTAGLLLQLGADINTKSNEGRTPLTYASGYGHHSVVRLLLEERADIDAKDNSGRTPLSYATEKGYDSIIRLLLEQGADINTKDNLGCTPLLYATEEGYDHIVDLLLEKGADINIKDNSGRTLLSYATEEGSVPLVEFLLEKGADINTKDNLGRTPLLYAADERYYSIIGLLLEKGAEMDHRDSAWIFR